MKRIFTATSLVATIFVCVGQAQSQQGTAPRLGQSSLKEVIAAMTTEEKVRLLVGMGMNLNIPGVQLIGEDDKKIPERVPGAAGRTHAITRLDIPSLTLSDGPAGVRINPIRNGNAGTYYATGFPIATLLASSWNTSLVQMPGVPEQAGQIVKALQNGTLSNQQLDENVERVLKIVLQSPAFKGYKYSERPDLKAHALIAREAACEGMVLLKNDDKALPLAPSARLAVFGNSAYDLIAGGTGSGDVNKAYVVSLDEGLKGAGYKVDDSLKNLYRQYLAEQKAKRPRPLPFFPPAPIAEMGVEKERLEQAANDSDIALITLGRNSGEFWPLTTLQNQVGWPRLGFTPSRSDLLRQG